MSLLKQIQAFDPAVDVFWNNRIKRWVVVQKTGKYRTPGESLRGCPAIAGEKTPYSPIFVCEWRVSDPHYPGGGIPCEPGVWIIRRLAILRKYKHLSERDIDRMIEKEEEEIERERSRVVDDWADDTRSNLVTYGARGNYSSEGIGKKHIRIGSFA